jgi:hypothetical protein
VPYTGLFLSNFVFCKETGYFDEAAKLKPLLHTWSPEAEEQFYLAWPLPLILGLRKWIVLRLILGISVRRSSMWFRRRGDANRDKARMYRLQPSRVTGGARFGARTGDRGPVLVDVRHRRLTMETASRTVLREVSDTSVRALTVAGKRVVVEEG